MSIVKMKRLELIAPQDRREELFEKLQRLGCVEIAREAGEPPEGAELKRPDGQALDRARERAGEARAALDVLKRCGVKEKKGFAPLPQVREGDFFDENAARSGQAQAEALDRSWQELTSLEAEAARLEGRREALRPWLELDVPLETASTSSVTALFCGVPLRVEISALEAALEKTGELWSITSAGTDREQRYFFLLCHKSVEDQVLGTLQGFGLSRVSFRETGTAAENDRRLAGELAKNRERQERLREKLTSGGETAALKQYLDRLGQDIAREEAKERIWDTDRTFWLSGWFPAAEEKRLEALLNSFPCAWETRDPTPEEYPQVPIQLKNAPVAAPFNVITEMYSMPAYDSVDPNPLMAPFFICFFGFMMNDIAYGLLMAIGTFVFLKKVRPKGNMRYMMSMFFLCGLSSIFWGCLTGSFFGDFLPKLFDLMGAAVPGYHDAAGDFVWFWKPLFSPINDIILVMIGSMALGVIQVFTGMAVSVIEKFRHGNALDAVTQEIAWYSILLGAAGAICGSAAAGMPAALGTVGIAMMILGAALLLAGSLIRAKSPIGIFTCLWDAYQSISGYFSDILSYLRLMALMMAGSIIASVFNTLGSVFGLAPFIIVAIIGNALNLALNLLGCYVHTMRLQCLEFFGRFYQDGGKPFRPLTVETKYVDILKEEM